jgi:pilus assembly protein CpaC
VTQDISGLKAKLFELLPGQTIEVRSANDSVVLSGTVPSAAAAGRAVAIAEKYAPKKVVNLLQVRGSQQVMLSVKVAEMSRTVARELGIKPQTIALGKSDNITFASLDALNVNRVGKAVLNWTTGFLTFNLLVDALEEKGIVKILAEPNLVALSGDTANFLAGGEFPVPEVQSGSGGAPTISVVFKQFGVSLAFTPTVIEGGLVNLVVSPEVSQIDTANSVTVSGFVIPGISTRRATTTVELRDGQSFAIAGLMQSNLQDQVRQLPGLGNLPVIGALFRDSTLSQTDTELVIIVTPTLVKPVAAGTLASATDYFVPPSTADLFFNGNIEGPGSGTPAAVRRALGAGASGGLSGNYGYIVK